MHVIYVIHDVRMKHRVEDKDSSNLGLQCKSDLVISAILNMDFFSYESEQVYIVTND